MVQLDPKDRATPSDMRGIYLRGKNGQLVQLDALANVQEGVGARQINHYNRIPSFTLGASLMPGLAQGAALDSIDVVAKQMLPPGFTTALAGESREYKESGSAIYFAFAIALLVVFMVLASQFESLLHPFVIMFTIPLAAIGAIFALYVTNSVINVVALIGRSGSGKSTALRCVNGLERIQSGEITICSHRLNGAEPDERTLRQLHLDVGIVFQSYNLFPHLTVGQNIMLAPRWVKKVSKAEAKERALEVLSPADALRDYPRVVVDDDGARAVSLGRPLDRFEGDGPWAVVDGDGRLLAVYEAAGDRAKPAVVVAPA